MTFALGVLVGMIIQETLWQMLNRSRAKFEKRWMHQSLSELQRLGQEFAAQGTSASGQDPQGLEAKPASAVAEGHAPE